MRCDIQHPDITYAMRFGLREAEPVAICEKCGKKIYHGTDAMVFDGEPYCEDCAMDIYHWIDEGEELYCEDCGEKIESVYYTFYGNLLCTKCLEANDID